MTIQTAAPAIRILLLSAFLLLAKMGYITWLTPETAHVLVNKIMDWLVVVTPATYAAWAAWKATPKQLIKAVDALPEVKTITVSPELADKVDSPTVVGKP